MRIYYATPPDPDSLSIPHRDGSESMHKYKVGDRVHVINHQILGTYPVEAQEWYEEEPNRIALLDTVVTIKDVWSDDNPYPMDNTSYYLLEEDVLEDIWADPDFVGFYTEYPARPLNETLPNI